MSVGEMVSVSKQRQARVRKPGCALTTDCGSQDMQLFLAPWVLLRPGGKDHRHWGGLFQHKNPAFEGFGPPPFRSKC